MSDVKPQLFSDQELSQRLAALPREQATQGFSQRVLRRLEEERSAKASAKVERRRSGRQYFAIAALAATLLVAVGIGLDRAERQQHELAEQLYVVVGP